MIKNTLKQFRMKDYLMNKKEFAQYLGISELQYGRYENSTNQPSLEIALIISKRLGKTVNDIWDIEDV